MAVASSYCSQCRSIHFPGLFRGAIPRSAYAYAYAWSIPFLRTSPCRFCLFLKEVLSSTEHFQNLPNRTAILIIEKFATVLSSPLTIPIRRLWVSACSAPCDERAFHLSPSQAMSYMRMHSDELSFFQYAIHEEAPHPVAPDDRESIGRGCVAEKLVDIKLIKSWIRRCENQHYPCEKVAR
jgi:hypothetical protein